MMCAVVGALVWGLQEQHQVDMANLLLNHIIRESHERGRDGRGFLLERHTDDGKVYSRRVKSIWKNHGDWSGRDFFKAASDWQTVIGNLRAEPTTEFVLDKSENDQQPYTCGEWSIVHNGTIANDKEIRSYKVDTPIDSAAIAEILEPTRGTNILDHFETQIRKLKGSFAIIAKKAKEPSLSIAVNYRPIWFVQVPFGIFFASSRHYFPDSLTPQMIKPYSIFHVEYRCSKSFIQTRTLLEHEARKALVVCSGGLDSVVAATYAKTELKLDITLLHFRYGSRAESREVSCIKQVSEHLNCDLKIVDVQNVYDKEDSPLLQHDSAIAGGEAGAEFAHEWVPARNLLLMSHAIALAEAKGFDTIILGNNLEESGAYPDNEPEFIYRLNDLLPFAVGDGKCIRILMPVGNLMKHEIVALGHKVGAPLHLTWSCYRNGELHCGRCGPCYMRQIAFHMNNLPEVIQYETDARNSIAGL